RGRRRRARMDRPGDGRRLPAGAPGRQRAGPPARGQRGPAGGRRIRVPAAAGRRRCRRAPARAGPVRLVPWLPRCLRPGRRRQAAAVGGRQRGPAGPRQAGRRPGPGHRRGRGGRGLALGTGGVRAGGDPAATRRLRARAAPPPQLQLMRSITGIPVAEFARRRRQLMGMAGDDAILVLPAAPQRVRSHDTHYPYRQDSDFWYLSGFPEPDAVLVLVPGRRHGEALLFCRERDPEREAWDGPRFGQEGAVAAFGMDDAYPIDDLDDILPGLLEGRSRVYYHFGRDAEFDLKLIGWVNRVRAQVRHGAQPPHDFLELGHLLHEQRLFKSSVQLRLMQKAAEISIRAKQEAMRPVRPGMYEYELQSELERVFRASDACPAYASIVGAGANGCVLHYIANNARVRDGDLVLVDAGAEYRCYAADITRTFPGNGRFGKEQRALHDLVGQAQAAALALARPGTPWIAMHEAAVETLTEGLLGLGLLKGS